MSSSEMCCHFYMPAIKLVAILIAHTKLLNVTQFKFLDHLIEENDICKLNKKSVKRQINHATPHFSADLKSVSVEDRSSLYVEHKINNK